jgi:3-deoxy-D-manno-octulosonate 8-phosphate phosphatase (KDO 8-P phosphatase)
MKCFNANYKDVIHKAGKIKLLVADLDRVPTNGGMVQDGRGMEYKKFQGKDGQVVTFLCNSGIKAGIITGRDVAFSKIHCK